MAPARDNLTRTIPTTVTKRRRRDASVVEDFWAGKSPRTVKAYRDDLQRVAAWAGFASIELFAVHFFSGGPGAAYREAVAFKGWALDRKWSPSYVNNHLAAIRSLVKFARRIGHVEWTLDVEGVKAETYRDTRGPGFDGVVAALDTASSSDDPWIASRDVAIVSLMSHLGLRRDEVVSLDLRHVDFDGRRVSVKRKKKVQRVWVTLPSETTDAVSAWVKARGRKAGPLFLSRAFSKQRTDRRLAESSVSLILKRIGESIGTPLRPHGLRHAAVTEVLEMTGGDVRSAQRFADHANVNTTIRYDDNRQDIQGQMAERLAARIEGARKQGKK